MKNLKNGLLNLRDIFRGTNVDLQYVMPFWRKLLSENEIYKGSKISLKLNDNSRVFDYDCDTSASWPELSSIFDISKAYNLTFELTIFAKSIYSDEPERLRLDQEMLINNGDMLEHYTFYKEDRLNPSQLHFEGVTRSLKKTVSGYILKAVEYKRVYNPLGRIQSYFRRTDSKEIALYLFEKNPRAWNYNR